jgi:hypothetical protein
VGLLGPWWRERPELIRREREWLEYQGFDIEGEEIPEHDDGVVRFRVAIDLDGRRHRLTVVYPDFFPFFRFEALTDDRYETHQNPHLGVLCLLPAPTDAWDTHDTAGEVIRDQLKRLVDDQPGQPGYDPAASGHVEPRARYYDYEHEAVVRIDRDWSIDPEHPGGTLVVGVDSDARPEVFRGTILEVQDENGDVIAQADAVIAARYDARRRIAGRWCRLQSPPAGAGHDEVRHSASAHRPQLAGPEFRSIGDAELDVVGVVFEDDVRPGERGDAWVFAITTRAEVRQAARRTGGRYTPPRRQSRAHLAPGMAAGRSDTTERVPELRALTSKKVLVIGTGALGAPISIEIARAGIGELVLVDHDFFEPGTAARWPLGWAVAGRAKVGALFQHLGLHWPYTQLNLLPARLGGVRLDSETPAQWKLLAEQLDHADLVIDATAEGGVSFMLSEICKASGLPLVCVTATEGGWGGRVARFRPDEDSWCWACMKHYIDDGTIPLPPAAPPELGTVFAATCSDPTFTGSGFDIAHIAIVAVRLAISTLCEAERDGYPEADWDAAVISLRDDPGILPGSATTHRLGVHTSCEWCQNRRSG